MEVGEDLKEFPNWDTRMEHKQGLYPHLMSLPP